jgi:hypothetical protein
MALSAAERAEDLDCAVVDELVRITAIAQGDAVLAVGAKVSALLVEFGAGHLSSSEADSGYRSPQNGQHEANINFGLPRFELSIL